MRSMEENIMGAKATQVAAKSRIMSGTATHQAPIVTKLSYELNMFDADILGTFFRKKNGHLIILIHFCIFHFLVTLREPNPSSSLES